MTSNTSLDAILSELRSNAELPFEESRNAPPGMYCSPEFLALEQEHIFAKEWICAGRADALSKPGDYLTMEIADQPIFVVHDRNGDIRAWSNVCLHRMSLLLEALDRVFVVVCQEKNAKTKIIGEHKL